MQSLAPLAAFMFAFEGSPIRNLVIGVSALALFIVVASFLRYWFFRYSISGDSILIRDGILNRKQLDIGFDRIQAVNTRQNPVYRMLKLTTVTFDTAGSSSEEGYLPAVGNAIADDLRARIRRTPVRAAPADGAIEQEARSDAQEILRLSARDIVLTGLSSGRVFLLLAVLGPLGELAEREAGEVVEETAVVEALSSLEPDAALGVMLVLAFVALLLVVLLVFSVIGAFLRFHGFRLTTDGDVLRSTGGLLTRHEHSVGRLKVQSVTVVQNAVLLLFDRRRVRIRQAGSSREGSSRAFLVPIARREQVQAIGREIYRDEYVDAVLDPGAGDFRQVSSYYMRSRILLLGALPALAAAALLWPLAGAAALFALSWLPVCLLAVRLHYRRLGFSLSPDGMAYRSGFVGKRVVVWLHRKVQRVTIRQSPFQRRLKLATIRFHLAAGSVRIPFIDHDTARQLRDYVLYKVESSQLAWH